MDLTFRFCEFGLRNTLFIFGRKTVVCLFVRSNFVSFGSLLKKFEALIELRKMLLRKKVFDVRLGNCLTLKQLNESL